MAEVNEILLSPQLIHKLYTIVGFFAQNGEQAVSDLLPVLALAFRLVLGFAPGRGSRIVEHRGSVLID